MRDECESLLTWRWLTILSEIKKNFSGSNDRILLCFWNNFNLLIICFLILSSLTLSSRALQLLWLLPQLPKSIHGQDAEKILIVTMNLLKRSTRFYPWSLLPPEGYSQTLKYLYVLKLNIKFISLLVNFLFWNTMKGKQSAWIIIILNAPHLVLSHFPQMMNMPISLLCKC